MKRSGVEKRSLSRGIYMDRNRWTILKEWDTVTHLSPSLSGPTVQTVFHTQTTNHISDQLSDMISVIIHPLVHSDSQIIAKAYNRLNSILGTNTKRKKNAVIMGFTVL